MVRKCLLTSSLLLVVIVSLLLGFPVMTTAAFHALPVHAGFVSVENLKTVETHIATLRARMMGNNHAIGDETARIAGPALENRQAR